MRTPDSRLLVLDPELRTVRQTFELPGEGGCAVRPDLSCAAVAGTDRITLVDRSGVVRWEVPHPAWTPRLGATGSEGSCIFSHDGDRIWAVVPGDTGDDDEMWVLDTETGRVLDRASLGCVTTGSHMVLHPDRRHVGVELGAPHDGWIGWAHLVDGRAVVTVRDARYEILADIHPTGDRYLTMPIEEDVVMVRRFDDGLVSAARGGAETFGGDVTFDTHGGYLDVDRIVATAFEGPTVLLTADTLELVDVVDYPEGAVTESPLPSGRGTWTTFQRSSGRVQLWRLQPATVAASGAAPD